MWHVIAINVSTTPGIQYYMQTCPIGNVETFKRIEFRLDYIFKQLRSTCHARIDQLSTKTETVNIESLGLQAMQ